MKRYVPNPPDFSQRRSICAAASSGVPITASPVAFMASTMSPRSVASPTSGSAATRLK
jgi:hypothetical protein